MQPVGKTTIYQMGCVKQKVSSSMCKMSRFTSSCTCTRSDFHRYILLYPMILAADKTSAQTAHSPPKVFCLGQLIMIQYTAKCKILFFFFFFFFFYTQKKNRYTTTSLLQVHYNTVFDTTRFKNGSQKYIDYIEK